MSSSAPRVYSEPGGQKPVLALSLDLIADDYENAKKDRSSVGHIDIQALDRSTDLFGGKSPKEK